MKTQTMVSFLFCSLFLTAQAAVDAERNSSASRAPLNQMPALTNEFQVYVPSSLDLQLRDQVQQQLRSTVQNFNPNRVSVLSQNGEITLKGIVRSTDESDTIEREAKKVAGVSRVQNNLLLSLD